MKIFITVPFDSFILIHKRTNKSKKKNDNRGQTKKEEEENSKTNNKEKVILYKIHQINLCINPTSM